MIKVHILYFAQFADIAGKPAETRMLSNPSPDALYLELKQAYHFPHEFTQIQVAINHRLSSHKTDLKDGDVIAFLPPMTGG